VDFANPTNATYVGRFAPSPTGPLHLGSLTTALASYLDALTHRGTWLIRIEDVDPPREVAGATEAILIALAAHGLHSQMEPLFQHTRHERYKTICENLLRQGHAFYCICSRKQQDHLGRCIANCQDRDISANGNNLRIKLPTGNRDFTDRIYGQVESERLAFDNAIIWRKDELPAYLLAATVDDIDSAVTDIVRGDDLLFETHRQLAFYAVLGESAPRYAHIPVVRNADGKKLSKQTGAERIDIHSPVQNLEEALRHLHPTWKHHSRDSSPSDWLKSLQDHWYLPTKNLQT